MAGAPQADDRHPDGGDGQHGDCSDQVWDCVHMHLLRASWHIGVSDPRMAASGWAAEQKLSVPPWVPWA